MYRTDATNVHVASTTPMPEKSIPTCRDLFRGWGTREFHPHPKFPTIIYDFSFHKFTVVSEATRSSIDVIKRKILYKTLYMRVK